MALEKSVLNLEAITSLLKTHYNLVVVDAQKLKLGTANCYCICTTDNRFFLKEFQSHFCQADLLREARLANYLKNNGLPTARFIPSCSGDYFFRHRNHLICLEEFLDGITYGYQDFPKALLNEMAETLGKLHTILAGYDLPKCMDAKWIIPFSIEDAVSQYDHLLTLLEKHRTDIHYQRIKDDLTYKKQLISRCSSLARFYEGITYSPSHGDFQGCQLICDKAHIRAIIDFSSASVLPVSWELMRSFIQSSQSSRSRARLDIEALCEYVRAYRQYAPLTKRDLAGMPYIYLYQLARSKYGYKEYLTTDSEDRDGLLEFAFWRTDICRELEHKAAAISEALSGM